MPYFIEAHGRGDRLEMAIISSPTQARDHIVAQLRDYAEEHPRRIIGLRYDLERISDLPYDRLIGHGFTVALGESRAICCAPSPPRAARLQQITEQLDGHTAARVAESILPIGELLASAARAASSEQYTQEGMCADLVLAGEAAALTVCRAAAKRSTIAVLA